MPLESRQQFSLRRLIVILSLWSVLLAICVLAENLRPLNSIFWGPIHFIQDGSRENQMMGWVLVLSSAPFFSPLAIRIRPWTALVAGCGVAWWCMWEIVGWGINV